MDKNVTVGLLTRGLDILKEFGWRQGEFGRKGQPHCAIGAVMAACDERRADNKSASCRCTEARECLEQVVGGSVGRWNDDPLRTEGEVHVAFEQAIAHAGKQASS